MKIDFVKSQTAISRTFGVADADSQTMANHLGRLFGNFINAQIPLALEENKDYLEGVVDRIHANLTLPEGERPAPEDVVFPFNRDTMLAEVVLTELNAMDLKPNYYTMAIFMFGTLAEDMSITMNQGLTRATAEWLGKRYTEKYNAPMNMAMVPAESHVGKLITAMRNGGSEIHTLPKPSATVGDQADGVPSVAVPYHPEDKGIINDAQAFADYVGTDPNFPGNIARPAEASPLGHA